MAGGPGIGVPEPLAGYGLLKVYGPGMDADHPGKQPVGSARSGPFYQADSPELRRWINVGGNVGLPIRGGLVAVDVDHPAFAELLADHLPPTLRTRTGSGGQHRFYRCPGWDGNRQFVVDGDDYGSTRSDGWQVVIPPSVHPNGERYRVLEHRPVAVVEESAFDAVVAAVEDSTEGSNVPGAGGGRVGGRCGDVAAVPERYPNRDAEWSTLRRWLDANGLLPRLRRVDENDRSGGDFLIAKCLAEGGFSEASIRSVLDRRPSDSKWHSRGETYKGRTVRKAIEAAVADPHVDFSSG